MTAPRKAKSRKPGFLGGRIWTLPPELEFYHWLLTPALSSLGEERAKHRRSTGWPRGDGSGLGAGSGCARFWGMASGVWDLGKPADQPVRINCGGLTVCGSGGGPAGERPASPIPTPGPGHLPARAGLGVKILLFWRFFAFATCQGLRLSANFVQIINNNKSGRSHEQRSQT